MNFETMFVFVCCCVMLQGIHGTPQLRSLGATMEPSEPIDLFRGFKESIDECKPRACGDRKMISNCHDAARYMKCALNECGYTRNRCYSTISIANSESDESERPRCFIPESICGSEFYDPNDSIELEERPFEREAQYEQMKEETLNLEDTQQPEYEPIEYFADWSQLQQYCDPDVCNRGFPATCDDALQYVKCAFDECGFTETQCHSAVPILNLVSESIIPGCVVPDSICGAWSISSSIFALMIVNFLFGK